MPDQMLLGIDMDHCLEGDIIGHEKKEKIEQLIKEANTYTEISPSNTGLHLFLALTAPLKLIANREGPFEAYTSGRFFTVTNNPYKEALSVRTVTPDEAIALLSIIGYPWGREVQQNGPVKPSIGLSLDDETVLSKMFTSKNGDKIKSLYGADITAYNNDDSAADMALCSYLAFWTGRNAEQMERLWLNSPLGEREKTQGRKDYRDRTIGKAIDGCPEVYSQVKKATEQIYLNEHGNTEPLKDSMINQCDFLLSKISKDTPKESILNALKPLLEILALNASVEEVEIYVRNKVKIELDIGTKDTDSIIKYFKKIQKPMLIKADVEKKKEEQLKKEPPLTEEEIKIAEQILKSPTLLYDVLKMVKKLGVVGEEKNVLLHYIILTSRKLKQPLSATVKGDSSSGKSYTLLTTIKLFPKSAYIDLTDATPQSFYYCPEDHFKHKIIVIFEKHGGERADYAIRTLQSEGKLKIQVTVKNPETGQFEAQTIEKEGPTGFVTTTTASLIHAENDTRNISMFPDQSSEQTSRVYESVDSRYLGIQPISNNELKPWHHAQLYLEQMPVYIPFAKSFRKYFPNHIVRTRRDYGHFLAIVETVAFLHQKQRENIELHGEKHIRATLVDAYIAKVIVEDSLSKSIYELPEKTIEVIKVAQEFLGEQFTVTKLADKLRWDRDTVAKWMKPGSKKGYFTIVEASKGSKVAEYTLTDKELPGNTFLPSIAELILDNPNESLGDIYNPLTGENIPPESISKVISTDAPTDSKGQKNTNLEEEKNTPVKPIGASVEKVEVPNNLETLNEFNSDLISEVEKDIDGIDNITPPLKKSIPSEGMPF